MGLLSACMPYPSKSSFMRKVPREWLYELLLSPLHLTFSDCFLWAVTGQTQTISEGKERAGLVVGQSGQCRGLEGGALFSRELLGKDSSPPNIPSAGLSPADTVHLFIVYAGKIQVPRVHVGGQLWAWALPAGPALLCPDSTLGAGCDTWPERPPSMRRGT